MTDLINLKAEFHHGARECRQILYQNNLFGYFRNKTWRCVHKKCSATISVDISTETIIDICRTNHIGHADKSPCEIEVRRAIEQMKLDVVKEPTVDHKEIYRNKQRSFQFCYCKFRKSYRG